MRCPVVWIALGASASTAWTTPQLLSLQRAAIYSPTAVKSSRHGENSCFLPLKQLGQDDYSPRIVQIAGAYPGLTKEDFMAVSSEPSPDAGQWNYDFSDSDGPQLGTVAIQGSELVHRIEDPVVVIADHLTLGVELPKVIKDPVDLILLVDRAQTEFAERKFFVVSTADDTLGIKAFSTKKDIPQGMEILGRIEMVQIPWLPGMSPTRTGFAEADEYFTA
ncbi:hypothetical protein ACA910_005060 [Epithemia clementina (nom. ined.)]